MRRAMTAAACSVGVCAVLLLGSPKTPAAAVHWSKRVAPQCTAALPARQGLPAPGFVRSQQDARAQASFTTKFTPEGRAQLVARAGELVVEKTVAPDGGFVIAFRMGDDEVRIALRLAGVDVVRGQTALHLEFGQSDDADFLKVKELLAGSKALRAHRVLAANLEPKTLATPAGVGTLLTDAFLAVLDGDASSVERLTERVTKRIQARLKRVRREDEDPGCYEKWEAEVMRAWYSYVVCMYSYSVWNPLKEACTVRYFVWIESAWWSFISCSAFPIRQE
jgi:hypothetical protein